MLKEVGASGQISLGKKYAGRLFEVETHADGRIVMRPVKIVPAIPTAQEQPPAYGKPQEQAAGKAAREWADGHAADIDQYNAWADGREPYSQRVRRWREQGA